MPEVGHVRRFYVPDFGETIPRDRLIRIYERAKPPMTVIAAPAAYGKSVLASQLARSERFDGVKWVRLPAGCSSAGDILSVAVASLSARPPGVEDRFVSLDARPVLADLVDDLIEALNGAREARCCLVLDNIDASGAAAVSDLMAAFEGSPGLPPTLMTVRSAATIAELPMWVWQVGARDLLLDDLEAAGVAAGVMGVVPDPTVLARLVDASGRQPGLFSVLARCGELGTDDWREVASARDISAVLQHLADSQLDEDQRFTLSCMAMLAEGTAEDLAAIPGCETSGTALRHIAAAMPIVRVRTDERGDRFVVHELAQMAFGPPEVPPTGDHDSLDALLQVLADRDDFDRVLSLLCERNDLRRLDHWLAVAGLPLLKRGRLSLLDRALSRFSAMELVRNPRLLVLRSAADWEAGRAGSATGTARVARELAEQEGDSAVLANALLILAQASLTQCDFLLARTYLERAIGLCGSSVSAETLAGLYGRRLFLDAALDDLTSYAASEEVALAFQSSGAAASEESGATVGFYSALARVFLCGDWAGSVANFEAASRSRGLTRGTRASAAYNLSACMFEMGRLAQAESALGEYDALIAGLGNEGWETSLPTLRAILGVVRGDDSQSLEPILSAASRVRDTGQHMAAISELCSASLAFAGSGRGEDALALAETASTYAEGLALRPLYWMTQLARATSMLLAGDAGAVRRATREIHAELSGKPAQYHHLHADLILAAIDCRGGDTAAATGRLRDHVPYVLTESPNCLCAMHLRAFPCLLGPLASAVGSEDLPVHMLKLVPSSYAEKALAAARGVVSPGVHASIARRLGCSTKGPKAGDEPTYEAALRVRLFGGLDVQRPDGSVGDHEWRKRKARLMFAMLATRCGKDVPREKLIEYLWPGMDTPTGLNNFYVVWSAMKRAISPGLARGEVCPYIEHRGGVCRVVARRVVTDLEEFDEQIAVAAKARASGDEAVESAALLRVRELYGGELLPGEVYDDWFVALRERCRHEFEDAMLRGAELLDSRGDPKAALALVRRALEHDPWREDLCQAVLRLQMAAGQRSAAIETYMSCRTRLVDDLGIDPSRETSKLYEQVLCMEDSREPHQPAQSGAV